MLGTAAAYGQEPSGVAEEGPTIEENQPAPADGGVADAEPFRVTVTIQETPEQAANAEASAQETREHDAADLDAQVRSAKAAERTAATAERQEVPAWVQIVLASIGTVLAILALGFSIWTALRADRTSRAQLRAYIQAELGTIVHYEVGAGVRLGINIHNVGQTPAYQVTTFSGIASMSKPVTDDDIVQALTWQENVIDSPKRANLTLGAGRSIGNYRTEQINFDFTGDQIKNFKNLIAKGLEGSLVVVIYGKILYEDVFKRAHVTNFFHVFDRASGQWQGTYGHRGNQAD